MAYLTHCDRYIKQSFSAFVAFHYPTAEASKQSQLVSQATKFYNKYRGWLSYLNNDIDEECFAKSLKHLHQRANGLKLPYKAGVCKANRLLVRVNLNYSTNPMFTYSDYQEKPSAPPNMETLTVPAHQVPFIKQQLEVMALLEKQ